MEKIKRTPEETALLCEVLKLILHKAVSHRFINHLWLNSSWVQAHEQNISFSNQTPTFINTMWLKMKEIIPFVYSKQQMDNLNNKEEIYSYIKNVTTQSFKKEDYISYMATCILNTTEVSVSCLLFRLTEHNLVFSSTQTHSIFSGIAKILKKEKSHGAGELLRNILIEQKTKNFTHIDVANNTAYKENDMLSHLLLIYNWNTYSEALSDLVDQSVIKEISANYRLISSGQNVLLKTLEFLDKVKDKYSIIIFDEYDRLRKLCNLNNPLIYAAFDKIYKSLGKNEKIVDVSVKEKKFLLVEYNHQSFCLKMRQLEVHKQRVDLIINNLIQTIYPKYFNKQDIQINQQINTQEYKLEVQYLFEEQQELEKFKDCLKNLERDTEKYLSLLLSNPTIINEIKTHSIYNLRAYLTDVFLRLSQHDELLNKIELSECLKSMTSYRGKKI